MGGGLPALGGGGSWCCGLLYDVVGAAHALAVVRRKNTHAHNRTATETKHQQGHRF